MLNFREMKIPDGDQNLGQHRGKLLLITGVRVLFFLAILAVTVLYQLKQPTFFNTESVFPLYMLLITAFVLNSFYLYFFETTQKLMVPTAFLFAFDAVFISALIFITGAQQSIFLFLYLVNIILCGFIFQRRGAFLIAVFTSLCFSNVIIFGPEMWGQTLYYALVLNNLAFFSVAGLSGYLSEQLNFMGRELNLKKQDIKALKDINKIIVDNISSGLVTIGSDYRIVLSNRSAGRILNQSRLVGQHIDEIFPGIVEVLKQGKFNEGRFQRRHELGNNESVILGFSLSPLKTHLNSVEGYIMIFQDLTEIVRMEGAMRRQDKLAAVGKLAAGIAHEIRNPLASISGSIELLKSMLKLESPDQHKLMDIMLKEITRLNLLITEFLEFVRPESRKLELCPIDNILGEVCDVAKVNNTLPKGVQQVRNLKSKAMISGDKNKLKQVFLNFVINSYQAMTDSSKKTLTVESFVDGFNLVVKISDTGHGMSEATQKRLFEPFFTTKPKGTGLGLATAHKILEIHDASIFVESIEDKGTQITIRFNEIIKQGSSNPGASNNEGQNTGS